jgi:hypothetical protein
MGKRSLFGPSEGSQVSLGQCPQAEPFCPAQGKPDTEIGRCGGLGLRRLFGCRSL